MAIYKASLLGGKGIEYQVWIPADTWRNAQRIADAAGAIVDAIIKDSTGGASDPDVLRAYELSTQAIRRAQRY